MSYSAKTFSVRTFSNTVAQGPQAILIVRIGQSNSYGAASLATLDAQYQQTYPLIKTFNGASFESLNYATNNNQYPGVTSCGASEFALLTSIQAHYNTTIYDVKYGVSGSFLGTSASPSVNWNASVRGSYFDKAVGAIQSAISVLRSLGFGRFKVFIFWDHGEADAQNETDKNNYQPNLSSVATAFDVVLSSQFGKVYWIVPEINQNIFQVNATSRAVSSATNATPITITTAAAHALTTGQYVTIQSVLGNTAANGSFQINVTGASTFELNGSVGNGAYSSGGNINAIYWKGAIQTAERAFVAARPSGTAYSFVTDAYARQADGVHYTFPGYDPKGIYPVTNFIIANGL